MRLARAVSSVLLFDARLRVERVEGWGEEGEDEPTRTERVKQPLE